MLKKYLFIYLHTFLIVFIFSLSINANTSLKIGIITDSLASSNFPGPTFINDMKQEILSLLPENIETTFSPVLATKWNRNLAQKQLNELLENKEIDMIIAIGLLIADIASKTPSLNKPVIAPSIFDHEHYFTNKESNTIFKKTNFNYFIPPYSIDSDLKKFQEITKFKHLAIIIDEKLAESMPATIPFLKDKVSALNVKTTMLLFNNSVPNIINEINNDIDAVYLTGIWSSADLFDELISNLNKKSLPTFSLAGHSEVRRGVLAGLAPEVNTTRIIRRIALNIQEITVERTKPEDLPINFLSPGDGGTLYINMKTAEEIGFSPSWKILREAELISDNISESIPKLTLINAIIEAIDNNQSLSSAQFDTEIAEKDKNIALSSLLPQVDIAWNWQEIDEDQAKVGSGMNPESIHSISGTLTQIIYADAPWTNLKIKTKLYEATKQDYQQKKLDIILSTSKSYLQLLKVLALKRIQQNNLKITRSNLEIAKFRRMIGYTSPAEQLRWEHQIALDQKSLSDVFATIEKVKFALNAIINRPLSTPIAIDNIDIPILLELTNEKGLITYLDTPKKFQTFSEFATKEGLKNSPTMKKLDNIIQSIELAISAAKRAYWLPSIAFSGNANNITKRSGEGVDQALLDLSNVDDTFMTLAVQVSFPLFQGNKKLATLQKAEAELLSATAQRNNAALKIEQNIRSILQETRAAYTAIITTEKAVDIAEETFELVSDSYKKGVSNYLHLLDAQEAVLIAKETLSTATFDFMIKMMTFYHSISKLDILSLKETPDTIWLDKLEKYFKEREFKNEKN